MVFFALSISEERKEPKEKRQSQAKSLIKRAEFVPSTHLPLPVGEKNWIKMSAGNKERFTFTENTDFCETMSSNWSPVPVTNYSSSFCPVGSNSAKTTSLWSHPSELTPKDYKPQPSLCWTPGEFATRIICFCSPFPQHSIPARGHWPSWVCDLLGFIFWQSTNQWNKDAQIDCDLVSFASAILPQRCQVKSKRTIAISRSDLLASRGKQTAENCCVHFSGEKKALPLTSNIWLFPVHFPVYIHICTSCNLQSN